MEKNEAIEVIKKNYPHVAESGSQFETALRFLSQNFKESEDERAREVAEKLTDAFIEKAWEWVDMHFHETEVNDRWGESRYVVMSGHDLFKDDLLKDFRKYMKGE